MAWRRSGLAGLLLAAAACVRAGGEPFELAWIGAALAGGSEGEIRVEGLAEGSPADRAGLRRGDRIVGCGKEGASAPFPGRRPAPLSLLLRECARAARSGASLELRVRRRDEERVLRIGSVSVPEHDPGCPDGCGRCRGMARAALAAIARDALGKDPSVSRVACAVEASVRGLALLAAGAAPGRKPYGDALAEATREAVRGIRWSLSHAGDRHKDAGWNVTNWALALGGLYLAELRLSGADAAFPAPTEREGSGDLGLSGDREPKDPLGDLLKRTARELVKRQEEGGGWGHGGPRGAPNAMGYVEVQACGSWCLASLARMRDAKAPVPEAAIRKAVEGLRACSEEGGICYRAGLKGTAEPARTGGALFALRCVGDGVERPLRGEMQAYLARRIDEVPDGHAAPTMHWLSAALGAAASGRGSPAWKAYWAEHALAAEVLLRRDGTFALWPSDVQEDPRWRGAIPERQLPESWATSVHALILLLPEGRILKPLLDAGK